MSDFKKNNLLYLILITLSIFCCSQSGLLFAKNKTLAHHLLHKKITYRKIHHARHSTIASAVKKDNVQFTIEPNNIVVAKNVAIPEDKISERMSDLSETPTATSTASTMPESVTSTINVINIPEESSPPAQDELSTQAVKPKPLELSEIFGTSKAEPPPTRIIKTNPTTQAPSFKTARDQGPTNLTPVSRQPEQARGPNPQQNSSPSLPARLLASLKQLSQKSSARVSAPAPAAAPVAPPTVSNQAKTPVSLPAASPSKTISAENSTPDLPTRLMASLRQLSRRNRVNTQNPATPIAKTSIEEPAYIHKKSVFGNIAASMHRHLVDFIQRTVETLHYSNYKLGGSKFDTTRGVYITDCSGFVDNILRKTSPRAYSSLVNATGAPTPATQHYYSFFQELSDNSDNYWNKVDDVDQLRAGDILVFRYKNSRGAQTGGHVMVVMDKPVRDTNVYFVRVADSAPTRHSEDTRQVHEGGIGIGTLLLKASKSGRPAAYAWGIGGMWNKNVNFAMARPMDWD